MQPLRWFLSLAGAVVIYFVTLVAILLLTRPLGGSASTSHLGAMMAACLLAVYGGAAIAPAGDRKLAALLLAGLGISLPALLLLVGLLQNKQVVNGTPEFLGAIIGAALGFKITPGPQKARLARY